jgi:type IV pilus assembly protein PilY1
VGAHPKNTTSGVLSNGGYMVYFGTGKYIESGDNTTSSTQTQTFYGVWDPDETSLPPGFDRSNLLQQEILNEVSALGADLRIISDNTISYRPDPMSSSAGDHLGWYMDLLNIAGGTDPKGERQVTTPALRGGRIIFTTLIPSGSSCVFGGAGWLMELDATDGSRLDAAPFDIDGDGVFDKVDDGTGTNVAPGGIKSTGGAPSSPGILTDAANSGQEYKYISGTDQGAIQVVSEQGDPTPPGGNARQSWRQLR